MSKIKDISVKQIKDSRGEGTLEVTVEIDNGEKVSASSPQGKSCGSYEAVCVETDKALENVESRIKYGLIGLNCRDQENIDSTLLGIDGTPDKRNLGSNAMLPVSLACARAGARSSHLPLWQYIKNFMGIHYKDRKPRLLMNVINGGLHAENNLEFQEYMIIPKGETIKESFEIGFKIYSELRNNFPNAPLGNEGGISPDFSNDKEPFEVLSNISQNLGLREKIDFGMDAAASNVKKDSKELSDFYKTLIEKFNLFYLEDPFSEHAFNSFSSFKKEFGDKLKIVGDDITVTNTFRMEEAERKGCVNGVIIKPNQIGTLCETIQAIKLAREYGWFVFVSHRSGETEDSFIADLAYGVGADGIKAGAPGPKERLSKYRRLIEIEEKEA